MWSEATRGIFFFQFWSHLWFEEFPFHMWKSSWSLSMGVYIEGSSPQRNLSSGPWGRGYCWEHCFLDCYQTNLRSMLCFLQHDGDGPVRFSWPVSGVLFHSTGKRKGERTECRVSHHSCWQVYKQPAMLRATGGPWVGLCRSLMMESMNVSMALCFPANWHETQGTRDFLTVDYQA